jgi:hypothetical protein
LYNLLSRKKNIFQSIQLKSTPIGIGSIYSNNFVEYDYLILNEIKMMGKLTKIRGKIFPLFGVLITIQHFKVRRDVYTLYQYLRV